MPRESVHAAGRTFLFSFLCRAAPSEAFANFTQDRRPRAKDFCAPTKSLWVAHASRVSGFGVAPKRSFLTAQSRETIDCTGKSSRSRGRNRQHARRLRYPNAWRQDCALSLTLPAGIGAVSRSRRVRSMAFVRWQLAAAPSTSFQPACSRRAPAS